MLLVSPEEQTGKGTVAMPGLDLDALRERFRGELIGPRDEGYDAARRVWNAAVDRRPTLVARCTCTADVLAAVRWARERDVLVAVRGGGHNVAGTGTCDDGLVIDLSPMKGVRVEPAGSTVRCQAGLTWVDLDHETQAFGLATTGGLVSSTGVSGFTLGGGIGWLQRRCGLACDNLLSADVVTADGSLVHVSAEREPELLWGLRGGGGNFGVVTSFEFRLHEVGPLITAGLVVYPYERAAEVLRGWRSAVVTLPDEAATTVVIRKAPPASFLPEAVHRTPVIMVAAFHSGPAADGAVALEPLRRLGPVIADVVQTRSYPQFQRIFDASWTPGFQNYWKAEYLAGLPDPAVEVLVDALGKITSPLSDIKLTAFGGVSARVPTEATAFSFRAVPLVLNINSRWPAPVDSDLHVGWTRDLWKAMQPFSAGGVYVNFLGDEGQDRVRAAYHPATYNRLARLKARFDPDNVFHLNHNIPPATATA
jgi:FAD/FMN-containing dehydrogenase